MSQGDGNGIIGAIDVSRETNLLLKEGPFMKKVFDIVIIGGGAAGLVAGIEAKTQNASLEVAVLEQESRVGKKLLVTGNGRCNLTNKGGLQGRYYGDVAFAQAGFEAFGVDETVNWMERHGISSVELEEGKVYPRSLQAGSVVDQLRFALEEAGVHLFSEKGVTAIEKGNPFVLHTSSGVIYGKKVLIATGGKSGLKPNQKANGYDLLKSLGHTHTPLYPAIVQITTNKEPIRPLKGIKVNGYVTAQTPKGERKEWGEILFTEYGISGPPVLQVSSLLSQNNGGKVVLDVIPDLSFAEIKEEIARRCKGFPNRTCEELLTGFINKRLGQTLVKLAGVDKLSRLCGSLSSKEQSAIAGVCKKFVLDVTGTNGWQQAQVTGGGMNTNEFSPVTMESKKVKGLYAAGEVLNVTGDCGGFNLQWAWTSGILAGRAMAKGE